ncbi:MAG: phosphoglycerate dehydrogenase, partial [Nitrososphaerota archaeon]|nr:phosphoglycerate dehydrogenase [Nitrososphaerota archaeon]
MSPRVTASGGARSGKGVPVVVLMDPETEKMGIPGLLEGYGETRKFYEPGGASTEELLADADALITVLGKVTAEVLRSAPRVKIVSVAAAGYDVVDVQAATAAGVPVTRAGTSSVESVAEHAIGLMILLSKRILPAVMEAKKGNWAYRNTPGAFGTEVSGKTVGIVGLGKVGSSLAKKCLALGTKVLAYDPYVAPGSVRELGGEPAQLEALLVNSDYVCLTGALTKENRHLIGSRELVLMKGNAFLINVARGGLIDGKALAAALAEGKIAGAGLDVMETEPPTDLSLLQLANCIVTGLLLAQGVKLRGGTVSAVSS